MPSKRGAQKLKGRPTKEPDEYVDNPQQIRARMRRGTLDPEIGRELLGGKPLDEWDLDELARGRPRNEQGTFSGLKPAWVTPALQEEAYNRFRKWVKGDLAAGSISALKRVRALVDDAESDRVRLDASKFLIEHVIGKPMQEIKGDVSLNLQMLLANVLVNPDGDASVIDVEAEEEAEAEYFDDLELDD